MLLWACQIIRQQANFDSCSALLLAGASVFGSYWRIAHPQNVDAMDWDLMSEDQVMGNRVCHLRESAIAAWPWLGEKPRTSMT